MNQVHQEFGAALLAAYLSGQETWETMTAMYPLWRTHRQEQFLHLGKVSVLASALFDLYLIAVSSGCLSLDEFIALPHGLTISVYSQKLCNVMGASRLLCSCFSPLCLLR